MNQLSTAIGRITARLPEHIRDSLTPEQQALRVFGIQLGETPCEHCGTVWGSASWPVRACTGCGAPRPRRCITSGCLHVIQPRGRQLPTRSGGTRWEWDEAGHYCGRCENDQRAGARVAIWRSRTPKRLQGFALEGFGRLDWHDSSAHRGGMKGWLARFRQARPDDQRSCLYVAGPTGVGKSVAMARMAHSLLVSEHWADDMLWCTEWELLSAHKAQYARGDDGDSLAREGRELLRRASEAPLLVLDELFSLKGEPYTQAGAREIGRLLFERLERRQLTLIASNEPVKGASIGSVAELCSRTFDERVGSRLHACAEVVPAYGDDLRRRAA